MANNCCVGGFVDDNCRTDKFRANKCMHKLLEEELQLLYLRIPGLKEIEEKLICDYHYKRYISFYSSSEYKCCDPWNKHSKNILCHLKIIDVKFSEKVKNVCNIDIIPGKKICVNCNTRFLTEIQNFTESIKYCIDPFKKHRSKIESELVCLTQESINYLLNVYNIKFSLQHKICNFCSTRLDFDILEYKQSLEAASTSASAIANSPGIIHSQQSITVSNTPESATCSSSNSEFQSVSQKKRNLEDILDSFGMPPFKRQKLTNERTVEKGLEIVQNIASQVSEAFEQAHAVELPKLNNIKQISNESSWFKNIIVNIQSKYQASSTFDEKISLLTLLPEDWKFAQVAKYFQCTVYMVSEAKKLRNNIGVLGRRLRKTYLRYSPEIRKEIEDYYLDDKNSSFCSGTKEFITVKVVGQPPEVFQKRMILFDLKDLYYNWIQVTNYSSVPCLTFFCQLKPQQCFFAGEPGTHNICICTTHQNIKLKLAGLKLNVSYKEAIAASVCSSESKICMLRECSKCPPKDAIYKFLSVDVDIDKMQDVKYSIWHTVEVTSKDVEKSSISRMTLVEFKEPFKAVLQSASDDIYNITEHHFIALKQKEHYCQCRKELDLDTGIICMDFAENYSFIAQDSIQGLYFNNVQATLFTAVLYYKHVSNNEVLFKSFCVISDSTIHQAYSIHAFQEAILNEIRKEFPWIKKLMYYSDGAPTQFKNKNYLINVCYHEKDFGITVTSHNFFMTSHGKSAPDGIGAAAKRKARRGALQGICILNAQQMFDHLSSTDSDIKYLYVSDKEVGLRGRKLQSRFKLAKTIKNTRKYHCFQPIDLQKMKVKLYSFDTESHVVHIS